MRQRIAPWTPEGFERYRELYPQTPPLALGRGTPRCIDWSSSLRGRVAKRHGRHRGACCARARRRPPSCSCEAISATTCRAISSRRARRSAASDSTPSSPATARAARSTATSPRSRASWRARPTRERLVFCGHSRGGLECLTAARRRRVIAARCDGVALSQTPHGPSFVIESVLHGRHRDTRLHGPAARDRDRATRGARASSARRGRARAHVRRLAGARRTRRPARWPFPVLQTASWSSRANRPGSTPSTGGSARSGQAGRTTGSSF